MIHTLGNYQGASRNLDGELCITFAIDDSNEMLEQLEKVKDKELVIEAKQYRKGRSLNANAYFWVLCQKIAEALGSDKDTIYLRQLQKYGQFNDVELIKEAVPVLTEAFRYSEELYSFEMDSREWCCIRLYTGSHLYDSLAMSKLIEGTVNDAHDIGVDTWTPDEIKRICQEWERRQE